jgi:gas vesicle protein
MSRSSDVVLAFLAGAVAGGVTALLLAPEKGSEARKKLRRRMDELSEKGGEYLEAAVGEFRERIGTPTAAPVIRSTPGANPEEGK